MLLAEHLLFPMTPHVRLFVVVGLPVIIYKTGGKINFYAQMGNTIIKKKINEKRSKRIEMTYNDKKTSALRTDIQSTDGRKK